jgi:2-polyprenyl-6-methoxyphenol hydroxylase-like FAD-dependent oxidoreductase
VTTDLLIAGGGPAGAALAILAGRAGFSVSLFEAGQFPREKACGEGLMPAGVGVLERLGLATAIAGCPLHGLRYHGFGVVAEATFPKARGEVVTGGAAPHGLGQRRLVLDDVLLRAARATPNVRVFEGAPVESVTWRAGRVVGLVVGGQAIAGRLIIGADGFRSRVRGALGLDAPPPHHPRWGVRVHFRLAADRSPGNFVEVFVGAGHELYLTPLPGGEVLVAALRERTERRPEPHDTAERSDEGALMALVAQHPALANRLRGASPVSTPRGRFPLACRAQAGVAPGVILLGDAAGFTDPVTGGGMAQALLSAELLARYLPRALAERDDEWLWRFDHRRRAMLRDYRLLTALLLYTTRRPRLARATLHLMRAQPAVMGHLVGVAAGLRRLTP